MTSTGSRQKDLVEEIRTDPDLPPVGVVDRTPMSMRSRIILIVFALLAAAGWGMVALSRGETVNAVWLVFAAVGSYVVAYRLYSKFVENTIAPPRDDRATPAEENNNGQDYMPTDRRVLFGHHFAAISGAGPLVGPVLAAQMGYLPGTLWIVVGVILAGGVQDYLVLHLSIRRRGRSLGQMVKDELGTTGGTIAIIAILTIMIMLLAVLGLVIVNALGESPWGVYSISMTIPIAFFMGFYLRYIRPGRVSEVSAIGVVLLLFAVISGGWVQDTTWGREIFTLDKPTLALLLAVYGFIASVLPVWMLLAPRDYLSTFMKIGTICLLAVGILVAAPEVQAPAVSQFAISGTGPAFAGSLFPFLFITIACGALSGFHALISSGTTPKLIEKESQARLIGYGGMLMESFVAVMAMITAVVIDQHLYFAMNAAAAATGGTPETAAAYVNGLKLVNGAGQPLPPVDAAYFAQHAADVGEKSIISRTGGAPTLAVGMAEIMTTFGVGAKAFWYHFAVMFEALFILTTVDAGTRVARFMLSDALGNVRGLERLKDPSWKVGAWACSVLVVLGWGSILYMGVKDPLGGINTLFPLFGISNQLLAAIGLTLVFVVVMKKGLFKWAWIPGVPLAWDVIVTMTASWQKIFSADPKIGYWALNAAAKKALADGKTTFGTAKSTAQIEQIVFNTTVQGTLSILYATLVALVVLIALGVSFKAWRVGGLPTSEVEGEPSRIFAPAGFVPTPAEEEVLAQWEAKGLDPSPSMARSH